MHPLTPRSQSSLLRWCPWYAPLILGLPLIASALAPDELAAHAAVIVWGLCSIIGTIINWVAQVIGEQAVSAARAAGRASEATERLQRLERRVNGASYRSAAD